MHKDWRIDFHDLEYTSPKAADKYFKHIIDDLIPKIKGLGLIILINGDGGFRIKGLGLIILITGMVASNATSKIS